MSSCWLLDMRLFFWNGWSWADRKERLSWSDHSYVRHGERPLSLVLELEQSLKLWAALEIMTLLISGPSLFVEFTARWHGGFTRSVLSNVLGVSRLGSWICQDGFVSSFQTSLWRGGCFTVISRGLCRTLVRELILQNRAPSLQSCEIRRWACSYWTLLLSCSCQLRRALEKTLGDHCEPATSPQTSGSLRQSHLNIFMIPAVTPQEYWIRSSRPI